MATTGKRGLSTTISGGTTGAVGSVESIRIGGGSVTVDDISTLANVWQTFIADQIDPGTISITAQYDADDVDTLFTNTGGTAETWTITTEDGDVFTCSGFISTPPEIDYARQKSIGVSFDIKLSGEPTFTVGT